MSAALKYEIGQLVWRATFDAREAFIPCPDCGGSGRLRVTFDDQTTVSIECRTCSLGFDPPSGSIKVYDRKPRANLVKITGAEIEGNKVEWRTSDSYRVGEEDLFDNEADCMVAATAMAERWDRDERERVNNKEKDTRSWAWNATYHRRCIKEANRQIAYHSAKLAVAAIKAKELAPTQEGDGTP